MIIKGVTYVSRQVSTMCLCQTGFPVHAVIRNGSDFAHESGGANNHRVDGRAVHPTIKSASRDRSSIA